MSDNAAQITQGHCIRFGTVAVDKKLITADDLHKALKIQVQDDMEGIPHRLIGNILFFDLGLISTEQIDEILKEFFRRREEKTTS